MKRALVFGLIACYFTAPSAQISQSSATLEQLQALRSAEESRFLAQERVCYERFAVTDCLRQVRSQKRIALSELNRQEVRLNDEERRKKATEQLGLIKEKSSPEKLEEAKVKRLEALKAQNERELNADKKRAEQRPQPVAAPNEKRLTAPSGASLSSAEAAQNKRDFERKLKEAQDRRQSREKGLLEKKTDKPAKPLPTE